MLAKQACHVYSFEHKSEQGFQGALEGVQSSAFSMASPLDACAMECSKGKGSLLAHLQLQKQIAHLASPWIQIWTVTSTKTFKNVYM